jgi:hypothetical protein
MADSQARIRVLNEILLTEASYFEDLKVVEEVFIGPLRANKVLPENDLRAIFGDWGTLVKTTDMIYQDLKRSVETRKPGGMAAVFAEFAPFLRAYGPFLINYEAGVKRKAELLEASDAGGDGSGGGGGGGGNIFKAFLDAALRDQRCRGLDLGSFLIMPVQRVPRYKLLLESLLKETPPSHPERAVVTKALQAVSDAAAHNNASMARNTDTFDRLLALQVSCSPRPSLRSSRV